MRQGCHMPLLLMSSLITRLPRNLYRHCRLVEVAFALRSLFRKSITSSPGRMSNTRERKTTSPICNVICIQNGYNLYLDTLFVHELIILVQDMIFVVRVQKVFTKSYLSTEKKKKERSGGRRTPDSQLSTDLVSLSLIIMEVQNDHIGRPSTHQTQTPWFFLSWLWEGRLAGGVS